MRILRYFHAKRTVLCLGLIGMIALASGCGGDANDTVAAKLPADPVHQVTRESFKTGRDGGGPGAAAPEKKP